MTGLFNHDFGVGALVCGSGRVRRVRHDDVTVSVESADEVSLLVNLTRTHRVEGRLAGVFRSDVPSMSSVTVMPPACAFRFQISGRCSVLQVRVRWCEIKQAAGAAGFDPDRLAIRPRLNEDDPTLARLLFAVAACDGDLALEDMIASLIQHLACEKAAPLARRRSTSLPPRTLSRVIDLIRSDPAAALTLAELAQEAGMSPFHFARGFRKDTGIPPHRYLVRCRVERALELLAQTDMPIGEIARAAGFAHASHQARHLSHWTGLPPDEYRKRITP